MNKPKLWEKSVTNYFVAIYALCGIGPGVLERISFWAQRHGVDLKKKDLSDPNEVLREFEREELINIMRGPALSEKNSDRIFVEALYTLNNTGKSQEERLEFLGVRSNISEQTMKTANPKNLLLALEKKEAAAAKKRGRK